MRKRILIFIILFVSIVSTIFIGIKIAKKNENKPPTKNESLEIISIQEIHQDNKYLLEKPAKMIGYKDKLYILDRKIMRILVFNKRGFLYTIGGSEIGEEQISQVFSFDISNDRLYLLSQVNRLEVFNISGEILKPIKFNLQSDYLVPSDIKVSEKYIYIGYQIGNTRVQRYNLSGSFIDNLIKNESHIDANKALLANPFNIYLVAAKDELLLINTFRGDIEIFNANNGMPLFSAKDYDTEIASKIWDIETELSTNNSKESSIEIKSIVMWRSAFNNNLNKAVVIPSQLSKTEQDRRGTFYVFNALKRHISHRSLRNCGKTVIFRDCCFLQDQLIFLDYNSKIYITEDML